MKQIKFYALVLLGIMLSINQVWAVEFSSFSYSTWGKSASFSGSTYNEVSQTQGDVTCTYTRNTGSLYANATSIRFYKDNVLKFDAPDGYKITAITFTGSGWTTDVTTNVATCTSTTSVLSWSGDAASVSFTRPSNATGYVTISSASVTLSSGTTYTDYLTECTEPVHYYVAGLGTNWDEGNWNEMTVVDGVASVSINLPISTAKEFKIVEKTGDEKTWYGNGDPIITDIIGKEYSNTGSNVGLYTGPEGEYTFTFNTTTHKVAVSYPTVSHPAEGYAYFQKQDSWSGFKVYNYTSGDNQLTNWDGSPAVTNTTTICGTVYYYTALATKYDNVIFRDNNTNQWKEIAVSGFSGKYCGDDYSATPQVWKEFSTYTITFDANGHGTAPEAISNIACGSKISAPTAPEATGYTFGGWYKDNECTDAWDFATAEVNESRTLYAKWTPKSYTLTWNLDGGSVVTAGTAAGSVAYGTELVAPIVEKTGYTFNGWTPAVPGTMGDGNATYTAQWTIQNYAITWMVNGEEWSGKGGSTGADYNTSIASVATAPESDACDEKVFMGWTDVEIDGETDTEPTLYKVLGDFPAVTAATTYYAVFADRNSGGGTVNDVLNRETTGVEDGSSTYTGWSNKTATTSAVYAGNSAGGNNSIQLRSKNSDSGIITTTSGGTLSSVSVVFEGNTASGRVLNVYGKNTAYSAASELFADATAGTLLGTIVNGTSTSLDITGTYEYVGVRSNESAIYLSSVTFSWGSDSYSGYVTTCTEKPTLDAPTGLTVSNLSSRSVTLSWTTVEHAETYVVTINGTKKDTISGTSIDLSDLTPGTLYSWSVTAQADGYKKATTDGENFTTKREFTVTYHSNGSTGGKSPVTGGKTTVIEGEQHTILGNIGEPKLTKSGYTFAGWHNSTTYSATPYYTIGQAIDVTGNITIYANWEPKQDTYVDDMHGVEIDAALTQGSYSAPNITSAGASYNDCETGHTVFIGWIKTEIGISGTNEAPDKLVHAGDAVKADGSTYHAVWAEED